MLLLLVASFFCPLIFHSFLPGSWEYVNQDSGFDFLRALTMFSQNDGGVYCKHTDSRCSCFTTAVWRRKKIVINIDI